ncbi:hypothetical protein G6F68_017099 [Rhizopus microsporus]|nr:hypothetical protein G6F68_017099 [Rhizopus microsporus]
MSRSRSNCNWTRVAPWLLDEVMALTPAMLPKARSSGAATVLAMLSGLAPGRSARTSMVGKSTWGSGATGNRRQATAPSSVSASARKMQATGRCSNARSMPRARQSGRAWRQRHAAGPGGGRTGRPRGW